MIEMKITAYELKDFKRIESARIEPGERSLVVIGGKNGQGKSSLIDGLTAAFGGAKETESQPVRNGADHSEIKIELDGGKVSLRRLINPDGRQTVEVYDESGKKRAPQSVLDDLVGSRFLDPLAFVRMSPAKQKDALIECIEWPDGFSYERWLAEYDATYEQRRDANRDAKRLALAEVEAQKLRPDSIPDALDVRELSEDLRDLQDRLQVGEQAVSDLITAREVERRERKSLHNIQEQRDTILRRMEFARTLLANAKQAVAKCEENCPPEGSLNSIKEKIEGIRDLMSSAGESVRARERALAREKAADHAHEKAASAANEASRIGGTLEALREQYSEAFAAAKTPIEGLRIEDGRVMLGDAPFEQASGAQKLRTALALAMAGSPHIRDVWVKDGALLDDESMALVQEVAEESGYRVWLERIGDGDDDAIVISEGRVVEK